MNIGTKGLYTWANPYGIKKKNALCLKRRPSSQQKLYRDGGQTMGSIDIPGRRKFLLRLTLVGAMDTDAACGNLRSMRNCRKNTISKLPFAIIRQEKVNGIPLNIDFNDYQATSANFSIL